MVAVDCAIGELETIPEAIPACRMVCPPGGSPEVFYMVLAPAVHEAHLRRALGIFTRLERYLPNTLELPTEMKAFENWQKHFCEWHGMIEVPRLRRVSQWLACPFRVKNLIPRLLERATVLGHGFSHQVNLQPFSPSREQQREAMLNMHALSNSPGVRAPLLLEQGILCDAFAHARANCEEVLGADDEAGARWLAGELRTAFETRYSTREFPAFELAFSKNSWGDAVEIGLRQDLAHSDDSGVLVSTAVGAAERHELLSIPPEVFAHAPRAKPTADADHATRTHGPMTPGYNESETEQNKDGPYAFISYQHGDTPVVDELVSYLAQSGIPTWFDRGIPGGTEWDCVIEERIQRCSVLLLILSQPAVRSRYVRREVKYADTIGKPILTLQLESTDLVAGLAMLLLQYQMIDLRAKGGREALSRDIRRLMQLP